MNRKGPRRRVAIVLIALAAAALAIWAAVWLAGDRMSFTDDAVDVELIPPAN